MISPINWGLSVLLSAAGREAVMSVDIERNKLEREAEELSELVLDDTRENHEALSDRLTQVYERLDEMDGEAVRQ